MNTKSLTLKVFLLIVLNDMVDAAAQLLLKKGASQTGFSDITPDNFFSFINNGIHSWALWLGILVYALNFLVWIVVLTKAELSVAMPVGSTTYLVIPLLSIFYFHEHVSLLRWCGILFIILGIHFVAQSKPTKEKALKNA